MEKMVDAGPEGLQGRLSAKKYMSITQVSKATATIDLQYLYEQGMLTKTWAGRFVRYALNIN
jgi:Fic family protein